MKLNLIEDSGFTLLEALISLMISSMIILLLVTGITHLNTAKKHIVLDADSLTASNGFINGDRQIEWHLFLNQLEYNLENSKNPKVMSYYFTVDEWDREKQQYDEVRYDRPEEVRRNFLRFKNNGNTRILSNVYLPQFKQNNGWLNLDFSFRNSESYQGRMWIDSWIEKDAEN